MPIVLVYLGNRMPLYALLNLRYLLRTFPNREVWLVTDHGAAARMAELAGANVFRCGSMDATWAAVRQRMPQRMDFRKGFWFFTFARLYALQEFMSEVGPLGALHVEADVWLHPDFPFEALSMLDVDIAFPLETAQTGVASTLWLRDDEVAREMVRLAELWAYEGRVASDMEFLALLWREGGLKVLPLPSAPPGEAWLPAETEAGAVQAMTAKDSSLGLFDGAAWGVDLLGEDPRNHWGLLRLFRQHSQGVIRTDRASLTVDVEGRLLVGDPEGRDSMPLYSLHVHSKDIWLFLFPGWRLRRRVALRATGKPRNRWLPHVTLRVLWSLGVPWLRRHLLHR